MNVVCAIWIREAIFDAPRVKKTIHSDEHRRLVRMLKARRVFLGLKQSDLAKRLEISQTFVSNYEQGERRLDLIELDQICEALEMSLVEFVTEFKGQTKLPGL